MAGLVVILPSTALAGRWVRAMSIAVAKLTDCLQREGAATRVRITEDGEVFSPVFRFVARFIVGPDRNIENYLHALAKATGGKIEITD